MKLTQQHYDELNAYIKDLIKVGGGPIWSCGFCGHPLQLEGVDLVCSAHCPEGVSHYTKKATSHITTCRPGN
jgi:hypothetical protein